MKKQFTIFLFACSILAHASIGIVTTTLPNGFTGHNYQQSLSASGGVAPYSWSKTSGTLPTGLSVNVRGSVFGVPTAISSTAYSFTLTVTDANSATATQGYTVTIAPHYLTPSQIVALWASRIVPSLAGLSDTWYSFLALSSGIGALPDGNLFFSVPPVVERVAKTYTANATVSGKDFVNGLLSVASGTITITTPVFDTIAKVLGNPPAGSTFDFVVLNNSSGGTVTLAAGTGGTIASAVTGGTTATLAENDNAGSAGWRVTITNTSAKKYQLSRLY